MAQKDLDKGDVESAMYRLRVDADKIRPTCRELYDILNANVDLNLFRKFIDFLK
jgi:hypothetical protein